jgi:uncharacterized protein (TIGR00299 family) protein
VKAVWVDATNGAAGDMLLAALLDAGASLDMVRSGLSRLRVEPVGVAVSQVRRHGFRATLVSVDAPEVATHRGLRAIADLIGAAAFPDLVWRFALDTFTRLAEAEARVHGIPVDDVHFHEVGALDAIADVVGCALALHDLGLLDAATRVVSPVAVGSGVTAAVHGRLPIPAPAVLELLARAGAPIAAHPAAMELCTPTGAALLATLATGWGPPPPLTARAAGSGAGTKDAESHPNLLRVLIGDAEAAGAEWSVAEFFEVQATIDDLDPRVWPDLLAALRTAGAADAWCTPALMRKGRPGQVLTVLVDGDLLDHACRVVFTQTTTLGLRVRAVQRRALRRDEVTVTVAGASVGVKRGFLGDRLVTAQPEYDDARAAAAQSGLSIAEVIASARQAATQDRHNSG